MPAGIVSVPALVDRVTEAASSTAAYLQIPPLHQYIDACRIAAKDLVASSRSTFHLLVLTFTPLCIILRQILRFLLIALGIIAEHTIKHGYVALQQAYAQARTGITWFVAWQRTLSTAAIATELAAVAVMFGLFLLRRYIRKHRYVERAQRWYQSKMEVVAGKYQRMVQTVSETSVLLALLLPHLLYVCGVGTLSYVAPWLLRYFALHTPSINIITIWIPLVRTVLFLHRWKCHADIMKKTDGDDSGTASAKVGEESSSPDNAKAKESGKTTRRPTTRSSAGRAADRYIKATMQSSSKSAKSPKGRKEREQLERISAEQSLRQEGMDLLQYWVVYALLCAFSQALTMLPVVGNVLTPASVPAIASRWAAKPGRVSRWVSSLRLSENLLKQGQLIFFVWLLYLPTSLTGAAVANSKKGRRSSVTNKVSEWESKIGSGDLNRPINIVYSWFARMAISIADFSLQLTQEGRTQNGTGAGEALESESGSTASSMVAKLFTKAIGFLQSFLEVAVFMKMIRASTRDWILRTIADGAALLPAAITLVMPGYFTAFGVLYVSNVVPAANSAVTRDAKDGDGDESMARYLRYWVIHCIFSGLVGSFRPVLAWIPLSTHAIWILWAYTQLEPVTKKIYSLLEWELLAFGLLRANTKENEDGTPVHDVDKTVTMQLLKKASSMLPKGATAPHGDGEDENKNGETTVEGVPKPEEEKETENYVHVDALHHAKIE